MFKLLVILFVIKLYARKDIFKSGILFSTVFNAVARLLISVVDAVFVDKLVTSGILFSTVVNTVFVVKLVASGILSSLSVIFVLQSVFLTRPLVSILFTLETNLL